MLPPKRGEAVGRDSRPKRGESIAQGVPKASIAGTAPVRTMVPTGVGTE